MLADRGVSRLGVTQFFIRLLQQRADANVKIDGLARVYRFGQQRASCRAVLMLPAVQAWSLLRWCRTACESSSARIFWDALDLPGELLRITLLSW